MLIASGEFDIHPPMPLTTSNAFGASADTVSSCALISVLDTRILLTPYPLDTSWNFAGRVLGCGASKQDVRLQDITRQRVTQTQRLARQLCTVPLFANVN